MAQNAADILGITGGNFQGDWDASTGSFPSPADTGDIYRVSVAGTFGSPAVTYNVDETVLYTGTTWIKLGSSSGGGGQGIAGTWDITPTITPAVNPTASVVAQATYDVSSRVLTSVYDLAGGPEFSSVTLNEPITHTNGGDSYVISVEAPVFPADASGGYIIFGFTDNPATLEADLLSVLGAGPTTANTFIAGGGGTGDGVTFASGVLVNKVNGTVGAQVAGAWSSSAANQRLDFYLDNTNGKSVHIVGSDLHEAAFPAVPVGATIYPFFGFLSVNPAVYQGYELIGNYSSAQNPYGGVTFNVMGTPQIITQVSSLPVGAAVDELYIVSVDTVTDPNVKPWMAEPFGYRLRDGDIIRIVNAAGGSEEVDLFNEAEGLASFNTTQFDAYAPLSEAEYLANGGFVNVENGPIYPDITFAGGEYSVSRPASKESTRETSPLVGIYPNDPTNTLDNDKQYRVEQRLGSTLTTKDSLTINTTAASREFAFTAWTDGGRSGYQVESITGQSLTRLVNFSPVACHIPSFGAGSTPVIEEIGYYFTVDTVVGLAVGDTLDLNSFYSGEEMTVIDITGSVVKAKISSTGFEADDVNTLETGAATQLTNQSSTTVNISSFTRYGILSEAAPSSVVGETLYYSTAGIYDNSAKGAVTRILATTADWNTLEELETAIGNDPTENHYALTAHIGTNSSSFNFNTLGPWGAKTVNVTPLVDTSITSSRSLTLSIVPEYIGLDLDLSGDIATEIDMQNEAVKIIFPLVGGGEKSYTFNQALLDDFVSDLTTASKTNSFLSENVISDGTNNGGAGYSIQTGYLNAQTKVYGWILGNGTSANGSQRVLLEGGGVDYTLTSGNLSIVSDVYDRYFIGGLEYLYNNGTEDIPLIIDRPTNDVNFVADIFDQTFAGIKGNRAVWSGIFNEYDRVYNFGDAAYVRGESGTSDQLGTTQTIYNDSYGSLHIVPGNFDPTLGAEMDYQYPNALQYVSTTGTFNGKRFIEGTYARWNGIETLPFPDISSDGFGNTVRLIKGATEDPKNHIYNSFKNAYDAAQGIEGVVTIEVFYGTTGSQIDIESGTYDLSEIRFKSLGGGSYFIADDSVRFTHTTASPTYDLSGMRLFYDPVSVTPDPLFQLYDGSINTINTDKDTYLTTDATNTHMFVCDDTYNPSFVILNFRGGDISQAIIDSDVTGTPPNFTVNLYDWTFFSGVSGGMFDTAQWNTVTVFNYCGMDIPSDLDSAGSIIDYVVSDSVVNQSGLTGNTVTEALDSIATSFDEVNALFDNATMYKIVSSGADNITTFASLNDMVTNAGPTFNFPTVVVMEKTIDTYSGAHLSTLDHIIFTDRAPGDVSGEAQNSSSRKQVVWAPASGTGGGGLPHTLINVVFKCNIPAGWDPISDSTGTIHLYNSSFINESSNVIPIEMSASFQTTTVHCHSGINYFGSTGVGAQATFAGSAWSNTVLRFEIYPNAHLNILSENGDSIVNTGSSSIVQFNNWGDEFKVVKGARHINATSIQFINYKNQYGTTGTDSSIGITYTVTPENYSVADNYSGIVPILEDLDVYVAGGYVNKVIIEGFGWNASTGIDVPSYVIDGSKHIIKNSRLRAHAITHQPGMFQGDVDLHMASTVSGASPVFSTSNQETISGQTWQVFDLTGCNLTLNKNTLGAARFFDQDNTAQLGRLIIVDNLTVNNVFTTSANGAFYFSADTDRRMMVVVNESLTLPDYSVVDQSTGTLNSSFLIKYRDNIAQERSTVSSQTTYIRGELREGTKGDPYEITGTSYDLDFNDVVMEATLVGNNASDITITLGATEMDNAPVGTELSFVKKGAGDVILSDASTDVNFASGVTTISSQYDKLCLQKEAANSWFGYGIDLPFQYNSTVQTSNFTAAVNTGYLVGVNVSASPDIGVTVTLPASPEIGDRIVLQDSDSDFTTYPMIVARNGNNIDGNASDKTVSINGSRLELVWVGGTIGWKTNVTNETPATITVTGTSHTVAATEMGNSLSTTNGATVSVTLPSDTTEPSIQVDQGIEVIQLGAGQVTFVADSGVTINSYNGDLKIAGQYAAATAIKTAANTWLVVGNLVA